MVAIRRVIAEQYPHHLYTRTGANEATQDEHGGWAESGGQWQHCGRCREETNGKGTSAAVGGGQFTTYSATIYLPQGAARIPEGTEVIVADTELDPADLDDKDRIRELVNGGLVRIAGTCLKFDTGRLHSRLWV
jgi:hypothetical protein